MVQALEAHAYTIVNKNFEDTVGIDRNDVEDDTYGVYEPVIEQLGWDTKVHPDMLLFATIKAAVNTPSSVSVMTARPSSPPRIRWARWAAGNAGRQYQLQRQRRVLVLDRRLAPDSAVHLPAAPRVRGHADEHAHRRGGLQPARIPLRRRRPRQHRRRTVAALLREQHGPEQSGQLRRGACGDAHDQNRRRTPFGALSSRKGVYLLVPPSLEEVGRQLLSSEFMAGAGASSSVPTTNIWRNSADLIVSEYLA